MNLGGLQGRRLPAVAASLAMLSLLMTGPAQAVSFSNGDFNVNWDTTISLGTQYRLDDPDPRILGLPVGGSAYSVNGDDGNQNYDTGIVSQVAKLTTEFELGYKNVGTFVRFRPGRHSRRLCLGEVRPRQPAGGAACR
jgi:hypothetical protein